MARISAPEHGNEQVEQQHLHDDHVDGHQDGHGVRAHAGRTPGLGRRLVPFRLVQTVIHKLHLACKNARIYLLTQAT